MRIYLIDYENVNETGIKGIKNLNSDDQVYIFYSNQTKTIPFERSIEMVMTKAQIDFIQIQKSGKNYLDFQLSTHFGYLSGKYSSSSFYVVSKDTGFDSVIDYGKGRKIDISRIVSIESDKKKENVVSPIKVLKSKEVAKPKEVTKSKEAVKSKQKNVEPPELYRKRIRVAIKSDKLMTSKYAEVYRAMAESKDKATLNNHLVKSFNNKGGEIYSHIKDIFEEYKSVAK